VYQRSYSQVRHIPPKMSDKCPTNVRRMSDKFESQHSLSPTIWSDILDLVGHFGRTWEWILKDFLFTFLEVNMSNILWSMRICKRTFFPVCRMCGYVNTLVYFYFAPYSCQERYLQGQYLSLSGTTVVRCIGAPHNQRIVR
jgi:hypothetical protein